MENDPADEAGADPAVAEQAATVAGPAAKVAPGSTLSREQVVALVGKLAPTGVGGFCATNFTPCADPVNAVVRACGGFTDTCDSSGTEDILPLTFLCLSNTCTAIAGQNQQTIACTVLTEGKSCSTGCGGSFCAPFSTECDVDTNRVQNCFSNGFCSNDSCTNQTFTQNIVGTCERETEGDRCTPRFTTCTGNTVGLCTTSHICACLLGPQ